jgi:hypothetical protein
MAFAQPSSGLPSGFTLGTGDHYGNAYMGGQQLNGLVNDSSSPTGYSYSFVNGQITPGATQSDWQSIINAENQNYFDQGGAGNPAAGAMVQASMPLNGGINGGGLGGPGDAGVGLPPGYVAPHAPTQAPPTNTAAPSSAPSSNFTTYNPMQIAGAAPSGQGADVPPTSTGSTGGGFLNGINTASGAGGNPLGYNLTQTDPNNALTAQTITPTGTDFMSQAKQLLASENAANDLQYQANLRDANRYAYSQGRGGSGIENTSLGDIAAQHTLQQNQLGNQLLYGALGQQNANQYANIGIAQQQQGFQNQQQQQAFSQALQQLLAGSSGDPSQISLILAQIFGSQAGGISNAASNYAAQNTANTNSQLQNQQFMELIKKLLQGGNTTTTPTPAVGE